MYKVGVSVSLISIIDFAGNMFSFSCTYFKMDFLGNWRMFRWYLCTAVGFLCVCGTFIQSAIVLDEKSYVFGSRKGFVEVLHVLISNSKL